MIENTDVAYHGEYAYIRTAKPRFSWVVPSFGNGTMQKSYRIQVASGKYNFACDDVDVWDSKKVYSNQSVAVAYGGNPLQSGKSYYWRVMTWDSNGVQSGWSEPKLFLTADTLDESPSYYPLMKTMERPARTYVCDKYMMVDFGNDAFAQLTLRMTTPPVKDDSLVVHLGERCKDGRVDRKPGGSIRYSRYNVPIHKGQSIYTIKLRPDKRNTALGRNESRVNPILMPQHIGEVTPFRYCEIEGACLDLVVERQMVHTPFSDKESSFICSDSILNMVWDLCKHSIKATSFCGVYIDGDRERLPYEADAYVNQLSHYAVDAEYSMARRTIDHVIFNPTWPTEWILLTPIIAWYDYLYSGDNSLLERHVKHLEAKCLTALMDSTGLISTKTGLLLPDVYKSIHFKGKQIRDIIDWPRSGAEGIEKEYGGETDGYERSVYNSAVNAYHYRALCAIKDIAKALGDEDLAYRYSVLANNLLERFNNVFFDDGHHRYIDAIGHNHSSLHANIFPVAFGMVDNEEKKNVANYIKTRGMACSVYGSQFLLDALYDCNEDEAALKLLASTSKRSWYNMIRIGSTITTEAWDDVFKPNQDWNHAWGAAAANIISRKLMGVEPLTPGFARMRIKPQPASLTSASITVPTISGPVYVDYNVGRLTVEIPANTEAEVWLPWNGKCKKIRGGKYVFVE